MLRTKIDPWKMKKKLQNPRAIERRGKVYLYYSYKGKTLYLPTGVEYEDYEKKYNLWKPRLNKIEDFIIKFKNEYGDRPSINEVRTYLEMSDNKAQSFYELFTEFINSLKIEESTRKNMLYRWRYFRMFDEKYGIELNRINEEMVYKFRDFLFTIDRHQHKLKNRKGLCNSTTFNLIGILQRVVEYGIKRQVIRRYEIDWKAVRKGVKREKDVEEALTREELEFLISKRDSFKTEPEEHMVCVYCGSTNIEKEFFKGGKEKKYCDDCDRSFLKYSDERELKNEREMKKALDFFLFQCGTSLRWSDAIKDMKSFYEDGKLVVRANKTKNNQYIPLTNLTRTLLDEYDWNFPFEDYVKEKKKNKNVRNIGIYRERYVDLIRKFLKRFSVEMASFKALRNDKSMIGKKEYVDKVPRYERFGSHSGRRTCVTLMILNDVPENEAMKITGHTSIEIFRGYADIRPETNKNYLEDIFV